MIKKLSLLLVISICLYVVFFWLLAYLRFDHFLIFTGDTAGLNQSFWSTIHGRFMQCTSWSFFFSTKEPISFFSTHFTPFYLLLIPIYYLVPGVSTLLFLRTVAVGFAAVPLFLIAKKELGKYNAILIVLIYLSFPATVFHINDNIYEIYFSLVFFFSTFYFYKQNRFPLFLLFLFITLTLKESMGATLIIFSFYALIEKKQIKWVLTPFLISLVWTVLVIGVIIPFYNKELTIIPSANWTELAIETIKKNGIWGIITFDYVKSAIKFLAPLGLFVPLLSVEALFLLPELLIERLVGANLGNNHYSFLIAGLCFLGLIYSLKNAGELFGRHKFVQKLLCKLKNDGIVFNYNAIVSIILIVMLILCAERSLYIFNPSNYLPNPHHESMHLAINSIPKEASVTCPDKYLAHLSNRFYLDYNHLDEYSGLNRNYEYYLVDTNSENNTPYDKLVADSLNLPGLLIERKDYKEIFKQDGIFVYKKISNYVN